MKNIARRADCCVRSLTRAGPKTGASVRVKFTSLPNGLIDGFLVRLGLPGCLRSGRFLSKLHASCPKL